MGALSPTKVVSTEFAGDVKVKIFTVTPAAASDTIDLSDYFSTIYGVQAHITAGLDANFTIIQTSWSTTTVTIKGLKADGSTDADDWTSAAIEVMVVGKNNQNDGS